ncbi:MAG: THUMP domain-containing protein [Desulfosarcinaceae bacterium]|nr:THUMP domain-containing protein [Desulfosarcinaceae bacterium]
MTQAAAFQKRIKRRVTAREHTFFAVTAPGVERLCAQELAHLSAAPAAIEPIAGGVRFRSRLTTLYLANRHLRTATRILMRLTEFKATRFDQIYARLKDFPWELYLYGDQVFHIHVRTRHSRLYHRRAIADQVEHSLQERLAVHGVSTPGPPIPQRIHVRLDQDRVTLSLDSSGEALYKRGYKTQGARAPLRETLAAAVLMWAGFQPGRPLVDPLCGGGTFSIEAALMTLGIPPGTRRTFAFETWPAFRPGHWDYLRRTNGSAETRPDHPQIFASDRKRTVCLALRSELERNGLATAIAVTCQELTTLTPERLPLRSTAPSRGIIVLNPPYGIRLGSRTAAKREIAAMGRHLRAHWKGWRVAVLLPEKALARHFGRALTLRPLSHGGLRLTLMIGQLR